MALSGRQTAPSREKCMRENSKLNRLLAVLVIALSLAAQGWSVAAESKSAEQIVDGLQKNYDATVDFIADFKQETEVKSLNRSLTAWGKLSFKRPGKMLWRYEEPKGQIVLTDGSHLYFLQPEQNQVIKRPLKTINTYFASNQKAKAEDSARSSWG